MKQESGCDSHVKQWQVKFVFEASGYNVTYVIVLFSTVSNVNDYYLYFVFFLTSRFMSERRDIFDEKKCYSQDQGECR